MASESTSRKSRRDVFAGLLFILIAAGFAAEGLNYPMGTLRSMGPGYMPVTLAIMLAALGAFIAIVGLVRPDPATAPSPVPWRAVVLLTVSLIFFGTFATRLGLVPCVFVCGTLSALGSEKNGPLAALTIGVALSAMCFVIFKEGLGLPIPTFGPLVAPYLDPILGTGVHPAPALDSVPAPAAPVAPAPATPPAPGNG
jgi:hypothetical protein